MKPKRIKIEVPATRTVPILCQEYPLQKPWCVGQGLLTGTVLVEIEIVTLHTGRRVAVRVPDEEDDRG